MRYYLFRYGEAGSYGYRTEKAKTVQEACKQAFGVVYDNTSPTIVYKDLGTRSPKYAAMHIKMEWHSAHGWSKMP